MFSSYPTFSRCTPDGDPEMIKLQLIPQGSSECLYFIMRFVDGQVNVESVDAPGDTHMKMMAKVRISGLF